MRCIAIAFALTSLAIGLTLAPGAAYADLLAIESSVPTTLSIERTDSGAYRLSHAGQQDTDITILGLSEAATVVYLLDESGRPGTKVEFKLDKGKLTFKAQAGAVYAIGLPDAVLAPSMAVELEGDATLPADGARELWVRVQNNSVEPLRASVQVNAPEGYKVSPGRKRQVQVGKRKDARVEFRLSKQPVTLADVLRGTDTIGVVLTHGKGGRIERSFSLRIADNPLRQGVIVEAENIAAEATEGAAIQIRTDKVNASGTTFSGWNDKDHWLAWHVEIPKTGKYAIVFRYCVDQELAHRDFQLDGSYPHEALKDVAFAATGGWSNTSNDWRHLLVADSASKPVLIQISAGQHAIRMNPIFGDGGCNLDYIMFLPESELPK